MKRVVAHALCVWAGVLYARAGDSGSDIQFADESLARSTYNVHFTYGIFGFGVAIADLDGDGDQDIIACGSASGRLGLLRNDGTGHFEDMWASSGLLPFDRHSAVSVADYDGDGAVDLYVTRSGGANRVLRHEGGWQFTDVTSRTGLGDSGAGNGMCWADFDGDGLLDVHVANRTITEVPAPNRLFRATSAGTFVDVAGQWGVADPGATFQAMWVDVDQDGQNELYVSNDKAHCDPSRNYLYEWNGHGFAEQPDSGAQVCINSMGVAVGDFNSDGWVDLYCANTSQGNVLLLGGAGGTFTQGQTLAGVESNTLSWSTIFADFANDGRLELFVANSGASNRLYVHTGVWPCADMAIPAGVPGSGLAHGAAVGDLNGDGRLDLVVAELWDRLKIYINETPAAGNYLRLRIIGNDRNTQAIGATVWATADGHTQERQLLCGGNNYKSQNEMIAHFGLADATTADLFVRWPSGETRRLTAAPGNTTWHVYPDAALGDADLDGVLEQSDLTALLHTAAQGAAVVRGTEHLDLNGDFRLDLLDAQMLASRIGADAALLDCDEDGVLDAAAMPVGETDLNADGLADGCQCLGDLTGDARVDYQDLGVLLAAYGQEDAGADLSGDSRTDASDVAILLDRYLSVCSE